MQNHNGDNERIKRRYLAYLREARRLSEQTLDSVAKSIARFEEYNNYRAFKAFHINQAIGFKKNLSAQLGQTGKPLSKSTLHSTLANLTRFFQWLSGQPGFKSRIQYTDADYFNLSEKDMRIASARRGQKAPTLEQVRHVIASMPETNDIERRNRALVAFAILTGARDSAIATMRLKHVNLQDCSVFQDAREVSTKFSKTFTSYFFPVGPEIRQIVDDWVIYLREKLLWGNDDPLFPATLVRCEDSRKFEVVGLSKKNWSNAAPIRIIFRQAFNNAGLPYFNPHSLRHTLVQFGQTVCRTPEDFKAWSQNLGHEQVLTTFLSYGEVAPSRQGEIIKALNVDSRAHAGTADITTLAKAIAAELRMN